MNIWIEHYAVVINHYIIVKSSFSKQNELFTGKINQAL